MGILIGLTGLKRAGKDSAANYLVQNYNFVKYALADPLKDAAKILFRWDDYRLEYEKEVVDPRWGISPRQVLQHLGTEWAQHSLNTDYPQFADTIGRNLWAYRFADWYKDHGTNNHVVVSDIRFPHEVSVVKSLGGFVIRIDRSGLDSNDNHESERYVNELPVVGTIQNDGTLIDLMTRTDEMFEWISGLVAAQ